jgi:hypothetical protein
VAGAVEDGSSNACQSAEVVSRTYPSFLLVVSRHLLLYLSEAGRQAGRQAASSRQQLGACRCTETPTWLAPPVNSMAREKSASVDAFLAPLIIVNDVVVEFGVVAYSKFSVV